MDRYSRMKLCLEGLSVGDSFGEKFFVHPDVVDGLIESRGLPSPPWYFTDDTLMAISIAEVLAAHGEINQDALAASFAARYDSSRGYGPGMHRLLRGDQRWNALGCRGPEPVRGTRVFWQWRSNASGANRRLFR